MHCEVIASIIYKCIQSLKGDGEPGSARIDVAQRVFAQIEGRRIAPPRHDQIGRYFAGADPAGAAGASGGIGFPFASTRFTSASTAA